MGVRAPGKLGHSVAFCWDLIKASTHTRQMDNCLQKKMHTLHIVLRTAAYYLTYSAYLAYHNMQNMQNMNPALFSCILFCIFCILICILQHIIWHIQLFCILQYAEYAECEPCTIFLRSVSHIVHIVLHTAAYFLTCSAYAAYCNMQNMQNMNPALFSCILLSILCILFCLYMQQYAR